METDLTPAELSLVSDQRWRLRNLYSCREEGTGTALAFRPRAEQELVYEHLTQRPGTPLYIVKSRRLGVSTAVDTLVADCAVFRRGFRGLVIDQTQADATKKMVEIVRFAVDSLPREITSDLIQDKRNDSELRVRQSAEPEAQDSVVYATTGGRGGDCSLLHVSEWGPISALDPARSREIRAGIFPAARKGMRIVETTWYGGKSGDLWELIKPIMDADANAEGTVLFFPWHSDPAAIRTEGMVTPEIEHYFRDLAAKLSKSFSPEQKKWYAAKKIEQGLWMRREYPSTLAEALSVPVPGTIYGDLIDQMREARRIQDFQADKGWPAYTFWDIGMSDFGCVWLVQFVGREILLLDYVSRTGQPAGYFAGWVKACEDRHGITVRDNYLPHDAAAREKGSGKTYVDALQEAGLTRVRVVHRTPDIWLGINALRVLLPRCYVHAVHCTAPYEDKDAGVTIPSGMDCLEFYRRKEETSGGIIREEPVHDQYSHGASALRTMAEAHRNGMLEGASFTAKEQRVVTRKVLRGPGQGAYPQLRRQTQVIR